MVFSPDGKRIALGPLTGDDVVLFDTATGRPTRSMKGHKGGILAIAFSPDGRLLATGSRDTTVLIWDLGESR
jgi:WD40 repeat protein